MDHSGERWAYREMAVLWNEDRVKGVDRGFAQG